MNDQLKWYVVRAVSGKEKKVKQYIDAEISRLGLTHLVPQVLIPMEKYSSPIWPNCLYNISFSANSSSSVIIAPPSIV